MATTLAGVVDDSTLLQNRRVIDMDPVIKVLEPDAAPFTQLLLNGRSRPARSQKVEWLEDELIPRVTALTANLATAVVTSMSITAGTGNYFRVNDIVRIAETGENVLVTATAATTLTIVRGYGTTAAAATTNATGDIIRLGNAAAEGQTLGQLLSTKQVAQFNYCQIFRNPLGFTQTLVNSELYGGNEPSFEASKKLSEHKISIEYQSFWGQRKLDTTGTNPRAVMGGVSDFISTYVTSIGGALTDKNTETFLRQGYRYGSREKTWFVAPLVGSALSSFPQGKLALPSDSQNSYGVSIQRYQSAQGKVAQIIVKNDWFDFQTVTAMWGTYGVLLDMSNIVYRPLRSTKLLPDRQAPDEDSVKQEYLTEMSLQVIHDRTHAIIKNVTSY